MSASVWTPSGFLNAVSSAFISFLQYGTGAVVRTVRDKLSDVVNPLDYGAVGDGITDDTAAIQAALTYIQSTNSKGKLVVSFGKYLINDTLTIPLKVGHTYSANIIIEGQYTSGLTADSSLVPQAATFVAGTGLSGKPMLKFTNGGNAPDGSELAAITLKNLNFHGNGNASKCVEIVGATGIAIERIACFVPTSYAIHLHPDGGTQEGYSCQLKDIYVLGTDEAHIVNPPEYGIYSTARWTVFERTVMDGAKTGIYATGDNCRFINNHLEGQQVCIASVCAGGGIGVFIGNHLNPYGAGVGTWGVQGIGILVQGTGPGAGAYNSFTNNYITASAGVGSIGINLKDSIINRITDNTIQVAGTAIGVQIDNTGVSAAGVYNTSLIGNIIESAGVAVSNNNAGGVLFLDRTNSFTGTIGGTSAALAIRSQNPLTPAGLTQNSTAIYGSSGIPSNVNGNNGDYYFRSDTPAVANQRIYVKSAGAWVGIV